MRVEVRLRVERGAVDPRELRVLLVPAPVRAREARQLDRLDRRCVLQVRPAAEIGERALRVERDVALGVAGELDLVRLALRLEARDRLLARDLLARPLATLRDLAADLLLDRLEVGLRDRLGELEVVVEAVGDRRADRDLHARVEAHDRLGEEVGGRVAQHVERVGILRVARREELDGLAVLERQAQVARRAVHAREHRLLGELRPDRARGVEAGRAVGELELGGVGEDDLHREGEDRQASGILEPACAPAPGSPSPSHRSCSSSCSSRVPAIDDAWENHPAHFWLVLGAALVATALGFSVTTAARRRRDARLFLISLAFIASAAFLGLHALATPGVLLGPNAGFELATPFGLLLAALFAAAASLELRSERAERSCASHRRCSSRSARSSSPGRRSRWRSSLRSTTRSPPSSSTAGSSSSRRRRRALRDRRVRLPPAPPKTPGALRPRVRARVRPARGGDGRHRVGAELAGLLVGVARAHARLVPPHRVRRAGRMARGALQRPLPRRDARRRPRGERRPRRPRRLHARTRRGTQRTRSRRCSMRTSGDHPADGARRRRGTPDRRRRAHGHLREGRDRQRPRVPGRPGGARAPARRAAHRRRPRRLAALPGRRVERRGPRGRRRRDERPSQARDRRRRRQPRRAATGRRAGGRSPRQRGDVPRARAAGDRRAAPAAAGKGKAGARDGLRPPPLATPADAGR